MSAELTELRAEVTRLREETKSLRKDLHELLRLLNVPEDSFREGTLQALSLVVESLAVRSTENPMVNAIYVGSDAEGGHIWFADKDWHRRCAIGANADGAWMAFQNSDGNTVLSLRETEKGDPQLYIAKPDGNPCAGLQIKDDRAIINVVDEKQRALVLLTSTEDGGEVIIANRNGKHAVTQKATGRGGLVTAHEPGGQVMGTMLATSDTGMIDIRGPQGAQAVALMADDSGGAVGVMDAEGNLIARIPPLPEHDDREEEP
jgi:antitoxin (DNA-binding transcriptional repressor) of toxin-antitoxin stability system